MTAMSWEARQQRATLNARNVREQTRRTKIVEIVPTQLQHSQEKAALFDRVTQITKEMSAGIAILRHVRDHAPGMFSGLLNQAIAFMVEWQTALDRIAAEGRQLAGQDCDSNERLLALAEQEDR